MGGKKVIETKGPEASRGPNATPLPSSVPLPLHHNLEYLDTPSPRARAGDKSSRRGDEVHALGRSTACFEETKW
jgi:hypothetical protein